MNRSDYPTHVMVLGWINIGFSLVLLFLGIFGLFFLSGIGVVAEDAEATRILGCVGVAGAVFFTALALPGLLAGYGLLKRHNWGRIIAIIVAVFDLFNIPIGTAIGIYALWVLTDERAADYFD